MILLVEDDVKLSRLLKEEIDDLGYRSVLVNDVAAAKGAMDDHSFELVISDLQLPDGTGMDLLKTLKSAGGDGADTGFIVITAFGTVDQAVDALKNGADDFLTKPLNFDHFAVSIKKVLEHYRLKRRLSRLERDMNVGSFHGLISKSKTMEDLFQTSRQIAKSDGPVLIVGESGVGKDLVAKAIHEESDRKGGRFVPVNCAGFPESLIESEFFGHQEGSFSGANKSKKGLFREAHGGTLFLDEIGEMPLALQAKLLRVLQDKKVRPVGAEREIEADVRVIAATNRDLEFEIQQGRFREDLYYRLETFSIFVPPLKDRKEDLDALVPYFCDLFGKKNEVPIKEATPEFMNVLRKYSYPGNVRELKNILERAALFSRDGVLNKENLPKRVLDSLENNLSEASDESAFKIELTDSGRPPVLAEVENAYVNFVLKLAKGNKKRAAGLLGIGRRTLYRRIDDDKEG